MAVRPGRRSRASYHQLGLVAGPGGSQDKVVSMDPGTQRLSPNTSPESRGHAASLPRASLLYGRCRTSLFKAVLC